jgi:hypothetical protein
MYQLPASLTHLSLGYDVEYVTALALPQTWQQQLCSLELVGGWLPQWSMVELPWLSLTSFCYTLSDEIASSRYWTKRGQARQEVKSALDLFDNDAHRRLLPNLSHLQLPELIDDY